LAGKLKLPPSIPDSYSPGSKEEAMCYAENASMSWMNTEGAMDWLKLLKLGESKPKGPKKIH